MTTLLHEQRHSQKKYTKGKHSNSLSDIIEALLTGRLINIHMHISVHALSSKQDSHLQ